MEIKPISGIDGFYISNEGRVYNSELVEINQFIGFRGYAQVSVKGQTLTVHRLVAAEFCDKDTPERRLVNHIDRDKLNNGSENLDFVTHYENNIHAALHRGNPVKPVVLAYPPNGTKPKFFQTKEDVMKELDISFKELWFAVKYATDIKGWKLHYNNLGIPKSIRKAAKPFVHETSQIKFMDVDTKEVIYFGSLKSAAEFLGTTASLVYQTITTPEKIRLCFKQYIVVRSEEDFPDISPELVADLRNHRGRPLFCVDVNTRRMEIHATAKAFYLLKGISKKKVTTVLERDVIVEVEGYVFAYMSSESLDRLNEYFESSRTDST